MSEIALFCVLHPASADAKARVQSLLAQSQSYYRSPEAKCTTWTYFVPSQRPKAPSQFITDAGADKSTIIAGLEIYTDKSALTDQLSSKAYKDYHTTIAAEGLYSRPEDLTAYYPAGGFVSRSETAPPFGSGNIVYTAKFICKEGKAEEVLKIFGEYTKWVKENEKDVLTYLALTRPKMPNEILVFERYRNLKALGQHGSSAEFKKMFKAITGSLDKTLLNEWTEMDGGFVGTVVGGGTQAQSKL